MERGIISKVLDYYFKNPDFKEELLRALREFFNRPKLAFGDKLELDDEEGEEKFNEWFVFDFRLKNKKTLLEDFCQKNPGNLSLSQLQSHKDLLDNEYAIFEILEIKIGEGLRLKNLRTEKEYWVREYRGTFQTKEGELLIGRIGKVEDHLELVGSDGYKLSKEAKHPFLGSLVVQSNLNPKKVRDFFKQMEKIRNAGCDSLKEKILDGGRCVCDICGKKGKMGALSHNERTGEPIVICYKCNLKITAERERITIKEAERRRKRMFEVNYLFRDIKMEEYLSRKGKKRIDSIEEANKVLERIVSAWNNLSIKQRKGFETMENEELRGIYKNIPVDFSKMDKIFKKLLIGTSFTFFSLIILGYFSAPFLPIDVLEILKQAFAPYFELTDWELVFTIFFHNALRVLLAILLGLIVGIVPFVFLVANGFIIGIVIYHVAILKGLGFTLLALIPHGIIEIPAVILGISLGFWVGLEVIKWLLGRKSEIKICLKTGLKIFLKLIVPALFLSSLIEVFITPQILKALIK